MLGRDMFGVASALSWVPADIFHHTRCDVVIRQFDHMFSSTKNAPRILAAALSSYDKTEEIEEDSRYVSLKIGMDGWGSEKDIVYELIDSH